MLGGMLMTCLAIEFTLGNPQARDILQRLLENLGSLYKFKGNHFDGYILRYDPIFFDRSWYNQPPASFNGAYYITADGTGYNYCTDLHDPRSRRLFTYNEWNFQPAYYRDANATEYRNWYSTAG
jgi:hypothetical protein